MIPHKLGFGAMRMPKDAAERKEMFSTYIESGGNYFDTAYVYEGSEEILKEDLIKEHPRNKYLIANKLPPWSIKNQKDCERIFKESLTRCGTDYFDYYLIHALDENNEEKALSAGAYEFLQKMKKEGYVRNIGFSFHGSTTDLENILISHPEMEFVMLQLNYIDILRGPAAAFQALALKHNKPIMVMEPVKGGMLASLPKEAETLLKAARPDDSIAAWAIRYAALLEGVATVISGMSTLEQVADNIRTLNPLEGMDDKEYALLDQALEVLGKESYIQCTGCKYCLSECPVNIEIASCIMLYNDFKRGIDKGNCKALYGAIPVGKRAEDCIGCGVCVPRCPQKLAIPEALETVAKEFV